VLISPLIHQWQIVIHHHVDLHDVDATCDDIRRNKDFVPSFTEVVNNSVTLCGVLGTMQ
jgi:hypothetical protein